MAAFGYHLNLIVKKSVSEDIHDNVFCYLDKKTPLETCVKEQVIKTINSKCSLWYLIYGFSPYMVKYSLCNLCFIQQRRFDFG